MSVSVLFVCLGNICRSPLAEGVFRHKAGEAELTDHFRIDSAGTGGWHVGDLPDTRGRQAAGSRGIDMSTQRARQLEGEDFHTFDFIFAMDQSNLANIERLKPPNGKAQCMLFLEFAGHGAGEVPDPYYGGADGFDSCLDLIEAGCEEILERLAKNYSAGSGSNA